MKVVEFGVTIIVAVIGSGLIQFFLNRKDSKNSKQDEIISRLDKLEKKIEEGDLDRKRMQMLVLMDGYKENAQEIMQVAEKYFTAGGDWYMSNLFNSWLEGSGIGKPEWFTGKE